MKRADERGFSLIELVIVVTIIGVIAALAIPFLQKALRASENGNTFATLRTVASTQVGYYQQNGRFGRITEINNIMANAIGTQSGTQVTRGKFAIVNVPDTPPDTQLRNSYEINAIRDVPSEGVLYKYKIDQSGTITQLFP